MKSHLITLCIALVVGFIGGSGAQLFQSKPVATDGALPQIQEIDPPASQLTSDLEGVTLQVEQMQDRIRSLEDQLYELAQRPAIDQVTPQDAIEVSANDDDPQARAASDIDILTAVGVDQDVASDILRRISQQQFRSMELGNLMRSSSPSERRGYVNELRELNQNRISLRSEIGDEMYEQYLYASGKNNRVKVSIVMAGSPAETNGVQPNDVILYYNDTKIIDVRDLQQAALSSDASDYSNIEILRDGNRMNLMLPGGTIGVQLQPMRVEPGQ